ncbi:4,5-DOPA dioxygenase extradiol [Martelella sp. HB161492]|uniref:4,5-DOPA-extradiol-dioxygenase n=1 Tax=Martelella sp. HB161492 TaxID=2720726 RepID=UPI0015921EDF|nr:4,5-DOPA dioxygenase extradiol [Martelella sp. HB161492]
MSDLNTAFANLPPTPRMPALFIGHGNPMNAIEDNAYSRSWHEVGENLPVPAAILCVSAHWMTSGTTLVHVGQQPATIHDFGGFPPELFAQQYPAPGAPELAQATIDLVRSSHLEADTEWGLDHGAWSVLIRMFPKANIPVFQLSLDLRKSARAHFELAQELKVLRERGVLIIGSGNLVHNLRALRPGAAPYDWAQIFDAHVAKSLEQRDFLSVTDALSLGRVAQLANPTPEHFLPSLYSIGVADPKDDLSFFNTSFDMASLSMRSFILS